MKTAPAWQMALVAFAVALSLALMWQQMFGSYQSEFGGHPDEAAHVVTGLFIRDAIVEAGHYAAGGFHGSPVKMGKEFADHYYTHYPKIGLGVWPPFFYLVQSAWTLPFGASRDSLFLLMGVLSAALAVMLFQVLRREFNASLAGVAAAVLISLPLVRNYYGMVMAETLSALLMFGAMMAFGNFLDRARRGDALWFGALTALAILTKGTGLAIVLAAPLALLIARRFDLLKRPVLWVAVLIVAVVAGPWTWATRNLGRGGWLQPSPSLGFTSQALPYYAGKLGLALGVVPLLLLAIGLFIKLRGDNSPRGRWAAAGALLLCVPVFQSIAPVGLEARHLIPVLPAALMFSVAGFDFIARRLSGARLAAFAAVVLLGTTGSLLPLTSKGDFGFAPLAERMLIDATPNDVALVSSDATGEGMFIADVALREARPGHVVQRASKSLASSTWSGSGYSPAFTSDNDVLAFLTDGKIRYLVVDDAVPTDKRREHHDQIRRVVEAHPDRFTLLLEREVFRGGKRQPVTAKLYKITPKN